MLYSYVRNNYGTAKLEISEVPIATRRRSLAAVSLPLLPLGPRQEVRPEEPGLRAVTNEVPRTGAPKPYLEIHGWL